MMRGSYKVVCPSDVVVVLVCVSTDWCLYGDVVA